MNEHGKLTCQVIQPEHTYEGKQAFTYFAGISAENTDSQGICMHLLTIQPGQRAKAHLHEDMRPRFMCCKVRLRCIMAKI